MVEEIDGPLVLVGAGKMGGAILAGLLSQGFDAKNVIVQDPAPAPEAVARLTDFGIAPVAQLNGLDQPPALILLAVKPQIMDDVLPSIAPFVGSKTLIVSIAAGRTIANLEAHLPDGTSVVRAMPNTPASIGKGITVCCANPNLSQHGKQLCDQLLATVGEVGWVDDEALIDAVTAVSGSGPAYVFWLTECLAKSGTDAGLDDELASKLARATVVGAGALMGQDTKSPAQLRQAVTSPGGTTEAALRVLMDDTEGMQKLMTKAVLEAKKRGRELAS